jgi:hypothetical protein
MVVIQQPQHGRQAKQPSDRGYRQAIPSSKRLNRSAIEVKHDFEFRQLY